MYTMTKELNVSPLECMQMPVSLVIELLAVHQEVESYKKDTLDEHIKESKINTKMR